METKHRTRNARTLFWPVCLVAVVALLMIGLVMYVLIRTHPGLGFAGLGLVAMGGYKTYRAKAAARRLPPGT